MPILVIFTRHVLQRMQERSITKQQVTRAVLKPDRIIADEDRISLFQRDIGSRTLEVVGKVSKNKVIVITTYWL